MGACGLRQGGEKGTRFLWFRMEEAVSYRAVTSEDPAGRGKCGSTEAVPFLRSRMQAEKLQGRVGRSRVEVNQRILQRNDGCVRREPPFPSVVITRSLCPIPLCKYGVSFVCVSIWCKCMCVYMYRGQRSTHLL